MSEYITTFTVSGLSTLDNNLLVQAGCSIVGDKISFTILREQDEPDQDFRDRIHRWIGRELSRLNVLTGRLHSATSVNTEPPIGSITITASAVWGNAPQLPPSHIGWSETGAVFRVQAWDVASKTQDTVLQFVMLDTICESAGVSQEWNDKLSWPPRFAEIRLIRNLLVHGEEHAKTSVKSYLERCTVSIPTNRFTNRHKHLELAKFRAPHLLASVWNIVLNDCVEAEVDLYSDQPATLKGIAIISDGPFNSPVR